RLALEFLDRLFPPPRGFGIRLWDGTVLPDSGASDPTLVLNSPHSLRRMFRLPIELSLGEAYLRGDFDLEGDLWAAGPMLAASRQTARSAREIATLGRLWLALPPASGARQGTGYGEGPARID